MIYKSFIYIAIVAVIADLLVGEFPIKHPVQYMGDFINKYKEFYYENNVKSGVILVISLVLAVVLIGIAIQYGLFTLVKKTVITLPVYILIIGMLASTGLASKSLKDHVKAVLNASDSEKRNKLAFLVSRNTDILDDKKVYGSLIETHSENLSDGVIAPLFYLLLFGLPGILVFKAVSTMDSMIGYKNEKYINFGRIAAILDDILNFIPARITGFFILLICKHKVSFNTWIKDAKRYSTSPNAGYPVAAAAHGLGVKLGGTVYYGQQKIDKAEVGKERTENYKQAAQAFLKIHSSIDAIVLLFLAILL